MICEVFFLEIGNSKEDNARNELKILQGNRNGMGRLLSYSTAFEKKCDCVVRYNNRAGSIYGTGLCCSTRRSKVLRGGIAIADMGGLLTSASG